MPRDKIEKKIIFELNQLDKLFEKYDDLLRESKRSKVDSIELAALASILHS